MPDLLALLWHHADLPGATFSADAVALWPEGALAQLLPLGLVEPTANAVSVVCDACGNDHVETVLFVDEPPELGLRAFLRCPEAGRVRVPLERLRQWRVSLPHLAALTAHALKTTGQLTEIVPGRLWFLGRLVSAGRSHEVFLGCGLWQPDGKNVVEHAPRYRAAVLPVVLVPAFPRRPPGPIRRRSFWHCRPYCRWLRSGSSLTRPFWKVLWPQLGRPSPPLPQERRPNGTWKRKRLPPC